MGYTTDFDGSVSIEPPLNELEIRYINAFADTRRMKRDYGPYYVGGDGGNDVIDYNSPDASQPSLWCQWITNEEGTVIGWDGNEKFYYADKWMQYIIDHFIGKNPLAKLNDPEHFDFLQGHTINGEIFADGEETDDNWKIEVVDGVVTVKEGAISYE